VLSDPRKRAEYDSGGLAGLAGYSVEDLLAGIDFGDLFGPAFGFGRAGEGGGILDRLFGAAGRRGPPRGRDLEVVVGVPLSTVLEGGEEPVTLERPARCGACSGSGARAGTAPATCPACGGNGERRESSRQGSVLVQRVSTCEACGGRGAILEDPCPACSGSGQTVERETLRLRIPPGIEDGATLRVAGGGMPAPEPGGEAGDAFVVVEAASDARFVRRGADLWCSEEVEAPDAVLGTRRDVPCLDGDLSLVIPAGTQPGATIRFPGRGLPRPGGGDRGDLYVTITVRIPEHVGMRERRLWERLRHPGSAPDLVREPPSRLQGAAGGRGSAN